MAERILVVEDERTLCTNVARYLSRAGYTVTAVESGRAALSELGRTTFDLVITDLRLPDLSGLDVLDHVRATSPESFVLIMTAYASVESAVEALRRGPTTTFSSRCRSPTCGRRSSTSPSTIASIERTLGCACCCAARATR